MTNALTRAADELVNDPVPRGYSTNGADIPGDTVLINEQYKAVDSEGLLTPEQIASWIANRDLWWDLHTHMMDLPPNDGKGAKTASWWYLRAAKPEAEGVDMTEGGLADLLLNALVSQGVIGDQDEQFLRTLAAGTISRAQEIAIPYPADEAFIRRAWGVALDSQVQGQGQDGRRRQ